ncbi:hypothetical protein CBR_g8114 [Chara braunii]|uniref:Uncharacterized protein n=1 Tax=Chara braunii TaxID=69332 RepID=A0A388KL82_CHABU|nr:hypothetical protein CBR_g8114 [Chara braunii]|eukprot:GBG70814.1 hypothetical protein CBR_g8114 [Chara braunii]
MGDVHEEGEVQLVPKFERKGRDILPGGCDECLWINLHPCEPWLIFSPHYKSLLQVWNYEDGKQVASWVVPDVYGVCEAGFIPQTEWIVVRRDKIYEVYEWQGSNLRLLTQLQTETGDSYTLIMAVHRSLPCFLAGFQYKELFLWHWSGKWEKTKFEGHNANVSALVFHPTEAQIFASASFDNIINIWDLGKRSIIKTLRDDGEGGICRMGLCRGGEKSHLITSHVGDPNVRVWDYRQGTCIAQWKAHNYDYNTASFYHPHLPYIFTAAADGKIRVWSESSYQQVSSFSCECVEWDKYGILNMIPSGISNKLILTGQGEFRVVEVQVREEDKKEEGQKQKESPSSCAKDLQAASSSIMVVVDEPAVVSRKTIEELEHKVSVNIKLQFEEKIKEVVAMVEQNCKKALEGVTVEHQAIERIQGERVQQLEKEMQTIRETSEKSKLRIQEVERQAQIVQQLEKEVQIITRRFENSIIQEVERALAEEKKHADLAERIRELENKLAEEHSK